MDATAGEISQERGVTLLVVRDSRVSTKGAATSNWQGALTMGITTQTQVKQNMSWSLNTKGKPLSQGI